MKYSNTVEYNITTKLDSSGLAKLQAQIKQLENSMQQMSNRNIINEEQVKSAKTQLEGLNSALTNSFNSSLGILDLSKFRAELDSSGVSAAGLQSAFNMMGAEGKAALNSLTTQIANFNGGMERTSSQIDKIFTTFSNTFRWGLVSSFFSQFMNAIHSSIDYVKELDDSLTQIMLVTDYNRDSMNEFARSANEAAKAVSMTTTGMTNASLIFAQQGYGLGQSQELATLSAKLANASQQDTATTSDQITAYMNAYGLENSISELTQAMDNWALIANISAADVGELAQASQRAASMANTVGVSGEQLAAQIATIESVTREAPEQIGNGLKTLYARFSDISAGGEDEDGVSLGDVTKQLNDIGVQVLDQFGNIRDVGDIMEDLMIVWDDLDETSKIAAAQSLAGKYQVNRFVSLMDNSDMYKEYLGATGSSAAGTLDQMNEEFANSIEGRSAKLQASLEGLFSTIFNTDDIYPWMDAAQGAVDLLQQFFDALGGGKTVLLGITALLTQAFSQNIARSINDIVANRNLGKIREQNVNGVNDTLDRVGIDKTQGVGAYISATADQAKLGALNNAQYDAYMNNVQQWADASTALARSEEQLTDNVNAVNLVFGKIAGNTDAAKLTDKGLNTFGAADERAQWTNQNIAKKAQEVDFSDVSDQSRLVANTLKEVQEELQKSQEGFLDSQKSAESLEQTLDKLGDQLSILSDEMQGYNSSAAEKMRENLESIREEFKQSGEVSEGSVKQVQKYITEMEHLSNTAANMDEIAARKIMNDAGDSAQQLQGNVNFNKIQEQRAAANAQESQASIDYQQEIKSVLDTLNAVQQLAFAWQAFQNLGSLWANEDLSTGEKVLQTIMNLTMAIPQLISALQTLQSMSGLKTIGNTVLHPAEMIKDFSNEANNIKKITDEAKIAQNALNTIGDGLKITAKAGAEASQAMLTELNGAVAAGETATSTFMGMNGVIGKAMASAAAEGATGLGILGAAAKAVLVEFWPFLLIGAAIAGVAAYIGAENEKAQKAKEEALEAFDEAQSRLEQIQSLHEKIDSFEEGYNAFKESGENGKELVAEAEEIAKAMKDAGMETQSATLHLAAIRAEASGAAEDFDILAQEIKKAQWDSEAQANLEIIRSAKEVLQTQNKGMEQVLSDQERLKNAQQELNNLDPWKPNYEARKIELEALISTLKETIAGEQEAIDAANAAMNAQGQLAGMNALGLNGDNNGMQTKARGWENRPTDTVRTADAETLREFFSQNVQGFELLDSMEQLDFMLQNVQDDAQKAAIQVQQLLESNNSLGEHHFGNNTYTDSEEITRALEQTDLTAENSLQLIASLDKDASKAEIKAKIADVQAEMESNGGDFTLALKATLDPEELEKVKEQVRDSISSMEPTDSDLDKDSFQETAKYFQEMAEELEDVPDEISLSSEALQDFTEAVLRYDDALQDADEHLEDWKKTLKNSSKSMDDAAEAFNGIRDLIGDLLDLDTSDLSHNFMESADALELLDTAIYGTGDEADAAYDQLNALANLDMAGMLNWEDGVWSLNDSFNQLRNAATGVSDDAVYAMDSLRGVMEGTISAPEIDASAFVAGLDDMVQSGEMSVDEALAAMDGAQVEADVVTETEDQSDTKNAIGWHPVPTEDLPIRARVPVLPVGGVLSGGATVDYQNFEGNVGGWTFEPDTQQETETKETTVSSVGYKANKNGNGSGKVTFKNGRHKSGSGGAKRNNATGGGGHSRPSSGGGGGGKGKSCFVAGTLVSVWGGFKPIEQIKKGNIVLSYNKQLGINEYSEVIQTMIHNTIEPIYTLYIKNEQLRVTGIHRFFVTDKITRGVPQWVHAADLKVGQWVLFADGTWHIIHKIEVNIEYQTVYNFEVSGNHNYYVGRNRILAHNKGGKGGGGGGGKAKTIEPKEKKEHKKDYYEEVNSRLDKTEKVLSRIEKEEDRLIGDKARANQNKQLKILQKEIDLQNKKLKILTEQEKKDVTASLKKNDKELEKLIQKYAMMAIPNPEFDSDGMIANYEQMSLAIDEAHNKLIEEYNKAAAAGNEERTKEIQKEIDKFDKLGEELLKNAQRSNKIQTEIEDIKNTIEELNDSIEDIRIEAYKASQEAIDNLKDVKESAAELNKLFRDFDDNPFSMNRWSIDDTPYGDLIESLSKLDDMYGVTADSAKEFYDELIKEKKAALAATTDGDEQDAISRAIQFFEDQKARLSNTDSLSNGLLGLAQQDLARLQEWMNNPNVADNPFGKNTSALFEAYQDAYERTLDLFKDYREIIQDTRDNILDIYDETEESIERQMDQYDRIIEKVERISDTYTLYYGEDSYDQLDQFYARQGDIMQNQLDKLTNAYDYWQDQYEKAIAIGDEKLIQEVQDKMDDAEDAMLDAAQELAELWVEKFENAVEASSQHIYKDLFGTNDIEELTDNWELQKDYMERYRDDVEKAYEVDKLRNKYLDLLDEVQGSSAQTQNRIRQQMQEQLDLLQNQTTVSEYDVKLANAKLEILQKQIALEDAQRNKNKMQLRRDTQGNYRYVYTADQGDVRQAQQDLEDSEYDAYEMTKEETIANNDRAISMLQDYIEKRAAIWNKYKDDSVARGEALANLEAEYSEIFDALQEDFTDTSKGMMDVLNWLVENGTANTTNAAIDMLNTLYDENGKLKDKTGQDWMDMATLIQDQVLPEIKDSVTKANLEMEQHAKDLKDSMVGTDGALTKIGSGAKDVEDSMNKAAKATNNLANVTKDLFIALGADKGELQAAINKLADYEKQLRSTQQSTSELRNQLTQANQTIAAKNEEAQNYRTILDLKSGAKDFGVGETYTIKKGTWVWYDRDGSTQFDTDNKPGFYVPEDVKVKVRTNYLNSGNRQAYYPVTIYPTDEKKWGTLVTDEDGKGANQTRRQQEWHIGIEAFRSALKYDTGGYTGDWKDQTQDNKNGKLALLHQKELVLNATDTENILAAVNVVREIAKAIKISTNYVSALSNNAYPINNKDTIQQRVEISATFPNATDADDIRNALIGLSDKAYQYAHRAI